MYQFSGFTDNGVFFRIQKDFMENNFFANLSKSAKAVWPVLGSHADKTGSCYPSIETIAIRAGIAKATAQTGLKELADKNMIRISKKHIQGGVKKNVYKVYAPPKNSKNVIFFYKSIIDSGVWHLLPPSAKTLYLGLRLLSVTDFDIIGYFNDDVVEDHQETFMNRDFDICYYNATEISNLVGISTRSFGSAFAALHSFGLIDEAIDEYDRYLFRIYFKSSKLVDIDKLNEIIKEKYQKQFRKVNRRRTDLFKPKVDVF